MAGDDRSFHSTPARCVRAKTWHREPLTHLWSRTCAWNICPPSSWKLTSRLPKRGGESDYSVIVTCDQLSGPHCCTIYVLPDSFIASLCSGSPGATARQHSHPSGNTLWRPRDTGMSTCAQISICEWIPVVNKPSGPWFALWLQLWMQHLLSYLALLNSAPAWTIIPGEPSERAREFCLYITGWCLSKSSHGIRQAACQ